MIYWSIIPEEVAFQDWDKELTLQEVIYKGKTMTVRSGAGGATIERIISTDPKDFLNKDLTPGSKINYST